MMNLSKNEQIHRRHVMKKLSNLARKFDSVAKFLFWLCAIVGGIVTVLMLLTPILPDDFFEYAVVTITLGSIEMQLAQDYVPSVEEMKLFFVGMSALSAIASVFACLVIRIIRKILKPMKSEIPFDSTVSTNLKKLSWIVLVSGILMTIADFITEIIQYQAFNFPNLFLSDKIISCNLSYVSDGSFIVGFGILYLLSYIFRYGEELQMQSDETL